MQSFTNQKAMNNAVASLRMEGLEISQKHIDLCNQLLNHEITLAQYIEFIKAIQEI